MRLIQITDLHITPRGRPLHGLDPVRRLADCIVDINRHAAAADFCVFSGDLTDRGDAGSYAVLRELLQDLSLPYYLMIGNHDLRHAFLEIFANTPRDENGFIQYQLLTEAGVFLFLDTVDEGRASGTYCKQRRAWLRMRLEDAGSRPVYLFTHHPPFDIGIPSLDRMRLDNPDEFARVLENADIRHLFFGHVHRALSGCWRGIPFSALPSTVHQIATDFTTSSPMPYSHGPPAYAFIDVHDDFTLLNLHSYLHQHPRQRPDGTWSKSPAED